MANKRQLKKSIKFVCGDIAGECLFSESAMNADEQKMSEAIIAIAELQEDSLQKVSISFDKSKKEVNNAKAYKKAHRDYYKAAYATLKDDFNKKIIDIVKMINDAIPQEVKAENKKN